MLLPLDVEEAAGQESEQEAAKEQLSACSQGSPGNGRVGTLQRQQEGLAAAEGELLDGMCLAPVSGRCCSCGNYPAQPQERHTAKHTTQCSWNSTHFQDIAQVGKHRCYPHGGLHHIVGCSKMTCFHWGPPWPNRAQPHTGGCMALSFSV
jgi:hypothetical protein